MKLLVLCLFLLPTIGYTKSYKCEFDSDRGPGKVQLSVEKSDSSVKFSFENKTYRYSECITEQDEIGTLIDCNTGNLDFMILLNRKASPVSGGVMSSTHDLFVDLDC